MPNATNIRNFGLMMRDITTENSRTAPRSALAELVSNTNSMKPHARRIAEEALTYFEVTYTPPPNPGTIFRTRPRPFP